MDALSVRSAAQRVTALVSCHGHDPDEPRVVLARQQHAAASIAAYIAKRTAGLPPLPADARARVLDALGPEAAR